MALSRLKNSLRNSSIYTDEISLLGQKVTYNIEVKSESDYKTNKYLYILTYSIMIISLGCCETFGAAIYTELGDQLNVGVDVIALILMCKSISFCISAISCAWITDHFDETHSYISLTMLFSCVSIIIIPHIESIAIMYVLFIIIGYSLGAIYVCFPVYIFRLYPKRQSLMIYILLSIYGSTKVILPLIIELSITLTDQYHLSLYFIAAIGLFDCICLLCVSTPEHDHLRTIKADISDKRKQKAAKTHNIANNSQSPIQPSYDFTTSFGNVSDDHATSENTMGSKLCSPNVNELRNENLFNTENDYIDEQESSTTMLESRTELEDISNQLAFVLRNNKKHVIYEWIIVILLSINMALFSAGQSVSTNFITTFCKDYYNNEATGRFMMSCYFLGQLVYRLVFALFIGDKYKKQFSPNKTISFGFIVMTFFSMIFVIWPKNIVVLYVVYSITGIFGGGIFPDIYKWCESMKPVSGVLSCFYIIGFALGDAIIILIIGEMFEEIGSYILPYPILITNFIGLWLTVCMTIIYSKYQKNKASILSTFYHGQ